MRNPDELWLEQPQLEEIASVEVHPATAHTPPFVPITPIGGLTQGPPTPPETLAITAAHGGAGATTWASLLGAADSAQKWPGYATYTTRTLLVARTSLSGLSAAQAAGLQWAAGLIPNVSLIGILLAPDIPGRLPKELRELERKVRAIFPAVIDAPYVHQWRIQTPKTATPNPKISAIITEITGRS